MIDLTRTTTDLLNGLNDSQNAEAWVELDGRYRPVLVNFARKLGLSDADAADVAQETLATFLKEYREGKYDRGRGRLRQWLIGIARYRALDVQRGGARKRVVRGESAIVDMSDDDALTQVWEAERRAVMLRQALRELREKTKTNEKTVRAFELLTLQQMSPNSVADQLEISVDEVYVAKSRCAAKLREILDRLEKAYEGEA